MSVASVEFRNGQGWPGVAKVARGGQRRPGWPGVVRDCQGWQGVAKGDQGGQGWSVVANGGWAWPGGARGPEVSRPLATHSLVRQVYPLPMFCSLTKHWFDFFLDRHHKHLFWFCLSYLIQNPFKDRVSNKKTIYQACIKHWKGGLSATP